MSSMNDVERRLGSYTIVPEAEYIPIKKNDLQDSMWELIARRRESDHKQAVIDRLMWEFCPDEMTEEQIRNWEERQVPAGPEAEEALIEALKFLRLDDEEK